MAQSLRSRLISGTISTSLGNLSTLVLGMVALMVAARYVPPADFGAFALLVVVVNFLVQVSTFGLELSLVRHTATEEGEEQRERLVSTALMSRLATISLVGALSIVAAPLLSVLFGAPIPPGLLVFVPVLFALHSMNSLLRAVAQAHLIFHRVALVAFVASVVDLVLVVVFLLYLGAGVEGLLWARTASSALTAGLLLVATPVRRRLSFRFSMLTELLRFGMPLQANDVLTFSFRRIDTLMIAALLGPADIAYYEIARKIPDSLRQLYSSFRQVFFPVMSRLAAENRTAEAAQLVNTVTRLLSFTLLLGALIALLFGSEIITLLFTEQYLPAVPAFVVLLVALAVGVVGNTLGTSVVAAGDSGKPVIVNTLHAVVSLAGNLLLIPIVGIVGAATASLMGGAATNPLNILFLRRRGVNASIDVYVRPLVVFGVSAAGALLLSPTGILERTLVVVAYLALALLLSVVTREDLQLVMRGAGTVVNRPKRSISAVGGRR